MNDPFKIDHNPHLVDIPPIYKMEDDINAMYRVTYTSLPITFCHDCIKHIKSWLSEGVLFPIYIVQSNCTISSEAHHRHTRIYRTDNLILKTGLINDQYYVKLTNDSRRKLIQYISFN